MTESIEGQLRRHATSLTIALRVDDQIAAAIAAARLRRTLECAGSSELAAALAVDLDVVHLLLASAPAPAQVTGDHRWRLVRWVGQLARVPDRPDGPDLFEVDAAGRDLGLARLAELYVSSSGFRTGSLVGATFDGARIDGCDFARANLERTSWRGARVTACNFAGAALVDATLEDASLIDCDLRGADLGVARRGRLASTARTAFVRCDLRETNWDRRSLAHVRLVDCKLHGVYGTPSLDAIEIRHPDLSPAGDRSIAGTPGDVIRAWRVARRGFSAPPRTDRLDPRRRARST